MRTGAEPWGATTRPRGIKKGMLAAMVDEPSSIAVLGAGSWGTALAIACARQGHDTRLWCRRSEQAEALRRDGENRRYLAGHPLGSVEVHDEFAGALRGAELVIWVVPSHGLRDTARAAAAHWELVGGRRASLIAAKGVEIDTLEPMAEVLRACLPAASTGAVAALGGPSFAAEVAAGQPTAVVIGCKDEAAARWMQAVLSDETLRAYHTEDVLGVELGGAFKNVIALAAGMIDGAGLGLNARAGLITRGLHEIRRLAEVLGARADTLAGLAGMGDLVLTCTGGLSRNRRVGVALGEGRQLQEILDEMGMVAEGVKNARSAHLLAQRHGVEMPIVETVHAILYDGLSVREAVAALMGRGLKAERR